MSDVTRILSAIEQGDPHAAEQLLPLVYDELRKLAAERMVQEKPGQTLQATALVHDVYVRLVDVDHAQKFNSRGHFFAAAAEAMRRILIETARRKRSQKHGGDLTRHDLECVDLAEPESSEEVVMLDEALQKLREQDKTAAEVVRLRFFAGLPLPEVAKLLDISPRTADEAARRYPSRTVPMESRRRRLSPKCSSARLAVCQLVTSISLPGSGLPVSDTLSCTRHL